jgi:Flp pilus assembly protein TadD
MISICLIVKDEEKWIRECISHLRPLADQIVVGDTGSKDQTIALAKGEGAEVYEIGWNEHFAEARNKTIEKAKEPWIFSFDADERISSLDLAEFRRTIEALDPKTDYEAIRLTRRDYTLNPSVSGFKPSIGEYPEEKTYPGYYTERMVRIFRNLPHIRWRHKVHELIDPTLKGQIFESNLVFHHYGYLPEEEARRGKSRFYQEIGKKKLDEDPHNWKAHYDLGSELIQAGKVSEAISALQEAAKLRPHEPMILSNLGYALMETGAFSKSEEVLRASLQVDAHHHDSLLNLAVNFMRQNRYAEAALYLEKLVQTHTESFLAFRNLGLCMIHLKKFETAVFNLIQALRIFPGFVDAKLDLAAVHFIVGKKELAETQVREVQKLDPQNSRASEMLRQMAAV